jgi:hypothetical protein
MIGLPMVHRRARRPGDSSAERERLQDPWQQDRRYEKE